MLQLLYWTLIFTDECLLSVGLFIFTSLPEISVPSSARQADRRATAYPSLLARVAITYIFKCSFFVYIIKINSLNMMHIYFFKNALVPFYIYFYFYFRIIFVATLKVQASTSLSFPRGNFLTKL